MPILIQMELNIAFFANVTGDHSTAKRFLQISDVRKEAINSIFWNANMKQWLDSWLSNTTHEVFSSAARINLPYRQLCLGLQQIC
jgi:alpha,alpha-trehalase